MFGEQKPSSRWGSVIHTEGGSKDDEEEDPIQSLIRQQAQIRKLKCPPDMPVDEWKENRQKRLAKIEKQIWDLIYLKRQKTGLRDKQKPL